MKHKSFKLLSESSYGGCDKQAGERRSSEWLLSTADEERGKALSSRGREVAVSHEGGIFKDKWQTERRACVFTRVEAPTWSSSRGSCDSLRSFPARCSPLLVAHNLIRVVISAAICRLALTERQEQAAPRVWSSR